MLLQRVSLNYYQCGLEYGAKGRIKTLKSEQIYENKLVSKEQMRTDLFEYIEVWYNRERRHSALGNLTIEQFNNKKQNIKKTA
ncbi:IS3 family transposase [Sphingobacterium kitahiroshimense]|uniref:IS3 family transposase n=1 Tax=Sphingobacterium kitahiroshimense TaxID=470446 RepID=UPI003D35FE97